MQRYKHGRPTIGVLSGWQVYETIIPVSFLDPVLRGIRAAAHAYQCSLLLACGMGPAPDRYGIRPAWPIPSPGTDFVPVGPWNTDGLIVVNPLRSKARERHVQDFIAAGHPVVFVGISEGGPAVGIDNEGGIRQAMAHLVAHGHQRIAFIAGHPEDAEGDSGDRLSAYRAAVQEYDLATDPDLVAYGFHVAEGGQQAMRQVLDSGVSFTAVLASNDESAIGAMQVLKEAGLEIPKDVALIGFDDRPETLVQEPPLTTIHAPVFGRGYRALELMLEYVGRRKSEAETVRVPTHLVVRQSCGCLSDDMVLIALNAHARPAPEIDRGAITSQLAQTISKAVLAEAQCLSLDEVHTLCQRLVEAFAVGQVQGDATGFLRTLDEILHRVEEVGDDADVWQVAVSALRDGIPWFLEARCSPAERPQVRLLAEDMIDQARVAISESARRQHRLYLVAQSWQADRVGPLTSRLLTALDEKDILSALAEHLPRVGIDHADVAFFEMEGDDPVARSVLRTVPDPEGTTFRFPSRQFPPEGLYSDDQPFSLALLPLVIREKLSGFVAFSAAEMDLFGNITRQLAAALNTARLYREATEGRRLAEEGRRLAEEANRLKTRLLSTVSHELRTPLSMIVGSSDMLLQEEAGDGPSLPERCRRDLVRIQASAHHLDSLIRDVLDLSRSEMGQLKLVREPLDLAEVLEVVGMVGEQLARDKGLGWRIEIPENLPGVWGDRTRLRQVALNLVSNAVRFTVQGEVALRVEAGNGAVTLTVSDTGLGIPPEEQEAIFDEFRQSERTTARGYGGLGLGLAICKRLVELHGGEIGVHSSGVEGAGSTFYFKLPTAKYPEDRPEVLTLPLAQEQTVLLVAEHAGGAERLYEHLTQRGFEAQVVTVDKTTDWFSRLLATPPAAVVLDMGMASKRGWEILQMLKGNPTTQDVPVLFCALAQEQDSGSILELDHLTKPIGTTELAQALERQGLALGSGEGKTILIVDDEPGVLEMHARIVQARSADWRVLKARDGREALDLIRQERPDLVLLDLMMPDLDGFGVLEAMRGEEMLRDIPVIVLTGQVLTEKDMVPLNRGVAAVLGKGLFSVEETLTHVEAALARARKLGPETQRLVRKAVAYIHEHYAEPMSREDMAAHIGVSKDYLTRCFNQEMGVSPSTYLTRHRMNQAKLLLAAREKSIDEVAVAVGIPDRNYFGRVFRREVGLPPGAYRRTC